MNIYRTTSDARAVYQPTAAVQVVTVASTAPGIVQLEPATRRYPGSAREALVTKYDSREIYSKDDD